MKTELKAFIEEMKREKIDLFITKDADDHISEYNDRYFSSMEFLSGFTGGDGTLVVTEEECCLWTDGRYFIQAAAELEGSGVRLMKEGQPDCPDMVEWIIEKLPLNGCLGFDGRCLSYASVSELIRRLRKKNVSIRCEKDFVGEVWTEGRPAKQAEKLWILEERYAGISAAEKLNQLKEELKNKGVDAMILSSMDETAWLLNLRGGDVPFCPVFDSFFLLDGAEAALYVSRAHLTAEVEDYIKQLGIALKYDTEAIYEDIAKLKSKSILANFNSCSYRMIRSIPSGCEIIDSPGPVCIRKCRKNRVEAENLKIAQLKDSVAVTRYMYWFQKEMAKGAEMSEISTAKKLHEFRAEQEGFLGDSFGTISAYGPNAAMCHYEPSEEKPVRILPKGLYLVDSGGHYPEGSTDITRTWACGPVTEEEKEGYTLTAMANLRLGAEIFPDRTSGLTLDLAAREVYWKRGLDFNHGTGHGVGYLLYVHEGPAQFRFRANTDTLYDELTEGVYISDEPGFYVEGKYGVRLENMMLVEQAFTNDFRKFMKLNALTLVPFDRSCINKELMTKEDIELYNAYHKRVYQNISGRLPEEERKWLAEMCRPL